MHLALLFAAATFHFTGDCAACANPVAATLIVDNYTQGTPLSAANFVSLTIYADNFSFTMTPANFLAIEGLMPAALPAPAAISILGWDQVNDVGVILNTTFYNQNAWELYFNDGPPVTGVNGIWTQTPEPSTGVALLCAAAVWKTIRASRRMQNATSPPPSRPCETPPS